MNTTGHRAIRLNEEEVDYYISDFLIKKTYEKIIFKPVVPVTIIEGQTAQTEYHATGSQAYKRNCQYY
jgi:hypothetical protein